jgi:aspartate/methionine/tyrosine aminotransferase
LLDTGLFYPEVNGTTALRGGIADLYAGATAANVSVTVGASQANSMVCQTLLAPGDEVVVMTPGYRQIWGTARNMGCVVRDLPLRADAGWRIDLDALDQVVTPRTKLVAIVNPNNPTGTIMTRTEMERVVAACARVGAWLHVDEVYHGTEHAGVADTPTFWGMYDRVICTNSFSRRYGLSGLRVGWAMTTPHMAEELWRRHEYAVIAAAAPSMTLAEIALAGEAPATVATPTPDYPGRLGSVARMVGNASRSIECATCPSHQYCLRALQPRPAIV